MKKETRDEKEREILHECLVNGRKELLVQEYGNLIFFTIRKTLQCFPNLQFIKEDIEDLRMEVFIQLFKNDCRKLRQYDPTKLGLPGWIKMIANKTTLDEVRKKHPHSLLKQKDLVPIEDVQELLKFDEKNRFDAREMLDIIWKSIETLCPRDNVVLKLFYFQRKSLSEIAVVIDRSKKTTQTIKDRAKEKLMKQLAELIEI